MDDDNDDATTFDRLVGRLSNEAGEDIVFLAGQVPPSVIEVEEYALADDFCETNVVSVVKTSIDCSTFNVLDCSNVRNERLYQV